MEFRQLTTFRTVASTLSFTRAAAILDYAQSSVTAQIQALEEHLGLPLFDRVGKRVTLTDAGQRLLWYAEKILELSDEARVAVAGMVAESPAGTVTISAPETLCTYRLPALLQSFRLNFQGVRLSFRPTPVADLRRAVGEGLLDVAFVLDEPILSSNLMVEPMVREPILVIASSDHPLAGRPLVQATDLEDQTVLLTEVGCSYRNLFTRKLAAAGVYPATTLEFNSIETIKQCVLAGMGLAVLPAVAAAREIEEGRLVALTWGEGDLEVVTQMLWHKDRWLSPALSVFLKMAREAFCNFNQ